MEKKSDPSKGYFKGYKLDPKDKYKLVKKADLPTKIKGAVKGAVSGAIPNPLAGNFGGPIGAVQGAVKGFNVRDKVINVDYFPKIKASEKKLQETVKRIEKTTGPLPRMPEALSNKKPSIDTVNPSVLNYVRDKARDATRSVGSGPEMNKTMPAPRNYGGITAQPMPYIPGPNSGKAENMPFKPGKTPGKIENMPFKPEAKQAPKPVLPAPIRAPSTPGTPPTPKPEFTGRPKPPPPAPIKPSRTTRNIQ
jgi:hypothetical protein